MAEDSRPGNDLIRFMVQKMEDRDTPQTAQPTYTPRKSVVDDSDDYTLLPIVAPPSLPPAQTHSTSNSGVKDYLQLFVDGILDLGESRLVRDHLAICPECAAYVTRLQAQSLAAARGIELTRTATSPLAIAAATGADAGRLPTRSLLKTGALGLVGACMFAMLAGVGAMVYTQLAVVRAQSSALNRISTELHASQHERAAIGAAIAASSRDNVDLRRRYAGMEATLNRISAETMLSAAAAKTAQATAAAAAAQVPVAQPPMVAVAAPSVPNELRTVIARALASQTLPVPASIQAMRAAPISSPSGPAVELISPVDTMVESASPVLRWRAAPGVTAYSVQILDGSGRLVSRSTRLAATFYTPEAALHRGGLYVWSVTPLPATDGFGSTLTVKRAAARFGVLSARKLAAIVRMRSAVPGSNLALAAANAQAGLMDCAAEETQALVQGNPQSAVARRLAESVRPWMVTRLN